MNTRLVSNKWLGVTLLIALFSLVAVGSLQAQGEGTAADTPSVPCKFMETEGDPRLPSKSLALACGDTVVLEVHSVESSGDHAVISVVVDGVIESGLYRQTGTGWERIELVVPTGDELAYMRELEDASANGTQDIGFTAAPAIRWGANTWAVQGEAYEDYHRELEDASADGTQDIGFAAAPAIRWGTNTWAVQGVAYEDYVRELEDASADGTQDIGFAAAPIIRSSGNTWAVQGEAFEDYMRELEDASAE